MAKIYLKKIKSNGCYDENKNPCYFRMKNKIVTCPNKPEKLKNVCTEEGIIFLQIDKPRKKIYLKKVKANDTCLKQNDLCRNDLLKLECYFINNCDKKPERLRYICVEQDIIFIQVFPENKTDIKNIKKAV